MKVIRKIENDLSQQNLQSLINWVNENIIKLTKTKSELPFKVYKTHIV